MLGTQNCATLDIGEERTGRKPVVSLVLLLVVVEAWTCTLSNKNSGNNAETTLPGKTVDLEIRIFEI